MILLSLVSKQTDTRLLPSNGGDASWYHIMISSIHWMLDCLKVERRLCPQTRARRSWTWTHVAALLGFWVSSEEAFLSTLLRVQLQIFSSIKFHQWNNAIVLSCEYLDRTKPQRQRLGKCQHAFWLSTANSTLSWIMECTKIEWRQDSKRWMMPLKTLVHDIAISCQQANWHTFVAIKWWRCFMISYYDFKHPLNARLSQSRKTLVPTDKGQALMNLNSCCSVAWLLGVLRRSLFNYFAACATLNPLFDRTSSTKHCYHAVMWVFGWDKPQDQRFGKCQHAFWLPTANSTLSWIMECTKIEWRQDSKRWMMPLKTLVHDIAISCQQANWHTFVAIKWWRCFMISYYDFEHPLNARLSQSRKTLVPTNKGQALMNLNSCCSVAWLLGVFRRSLLKYFAACAASNLLFDQISSMKQCYRAVMWVFG